MIKRLAILAVLSVGFLGYTKALGVTGPVPADSPTSGVKDTASQKKPDNAKQSIAITPRSKRDWLDISTFIVGVILAGITGTGVYVAWRGLPQFKKQAKAAEDAAIAAQDGAEAALLNARAVMNSERPWIIVEAEGYPEISFKITNKGKTPAQLIWYDSTPKYMTPIPGESMGKASYGKYFEEQAQILNEPMIFPGESRSVAYYSVSVVKEELPDLWNELNSLKRLLYVYSAIKYKGPFSDDIFVTAYCYRILRNPRMAGDHGYNYNT